MISIQDFINWKQDPVTIAFFSAVIERIEATKESLSYSAGLSPSDDNFHRGYIQANRDILETSVDDVEESQDA